MTKKIIILGAMGNCVDILDTLLDINDARHEAVYECAGFLDDNERLQGKEIRGVKVLGPLSANRNYPDCFFINGIGSQKDFWKKPTIISKTAIPIERFETVIHPTASVSRTAVLGHGCVVFQHVTITTNVKIGNHVVILPNSVISHDDIIDDYTIITGGVNISGNVEIGKACFLGTNSSIINNIKIGDQCLVGMGSVVLHPVEAGSVVVGNPAHFIRRTIPDKGGIPDSSDYGTFEGSKTS